MGQNTLRFPLLLELGLSPNEASLYELLLEKGPTKPSDLVEPSGLGRGNVYNVLQQLSEKSLVFLKERGKFQTYEAVDPTQLQALLDRKQQEALRLREAFQGTLPQLTSLFRLSTGKPAIQMFEGIEGASEALLDSLKAKTEILTISDPTAISGPLAAINQLYVKKRIAQGVTKRILIPSGDEMNARALRSTNAVTRVRLLPALSSGFQVITELYDNKIAFYTLQPDKLVAFIIENEQVAQLQRLQFEALWNSATPPVPTQA